MDLHDFDSPGLDAKLKCFVCQNYLSYFPISLCSNNQSVCGRCDIPEATIAFRNEAFEDLGQLIKFPCRYQSEGCSEALVPQDIPKHEENCKFRVVPCIISKPIQCEWRGSLQILTQHCHEKHSDIILKNGEFMIDLSVSSECDSLLERNDPFYILSKKNCAESKTLSCAIYTKYETATRSVSASITVKRGNKKLSVDLMTTSFEDMVYTELCLHSLISKNEEENMLLCEVKLQTSEAEKYRLHEELYSSLLSMLKCSLCHSYAISQVYRSCKSNKTVCASCMWREPKLLRDANLGKISKFVNYPCKYHETGCPFIHLQPFKSRHENICEYRTKYCPLLEFCLCNWKGLVKDLDDHVSNNHQDLIVSSGDILELSNKDTEKKCVIVRVSKLLFRMVYCYCSPHFLWSVQSINGGTNFKYQIETIDDKNSDKKLLMRMRSYLNVTETKDVFKYLTCCCFFHEDQVRCGLQPNSQEINVKFRARVLK